MKVYSVIFVVSVLLAAPFAHGVEVQGHRGARARFPENTLPAFEYAIKQGVNVLELDMAVTKDGKVVISHDPHILPELCLDPEGKKIEKAPLIHSLTLEEVRKYDCGTLKNPKFPNQKPVPGTRIPTLDEVFDLAEGEKVGFNIETKIQLQEPKWSPNPKQFIDVVFEVLERRKMMSRITLQSFDYRTLIEAKRRNPAIRISALSENPLEPLTLTARKLHAEIISPKWEMLHSWTVRRLHKRGVKIIPWTADGPEAWDKMIKLGVDGIISDDPEAMMDYLKSKNVPIGPISYETKKNET